jgi:hypothetical protein
MKALTVQQPWAWAIIHGGKDVENRTQLWSYRGPLAIHAGSRFSQRGADFSPLQRAYAAWLGFRHWEGPYGGRTAMPIDRTDPRDAELLDVGAIIGVVDLVGAHRAAWEPGECCPPWGEASYIEHGGTKRVDIVHLVLANPRSVAPIDTPGRLGLWTLPDDVAAALADAAEDGTE